MPESATNLEPVSVEQDGRILTGVEVSPESLTETMARHALPDAGVAVEVPAEAPHPQVLETPASEPPAEPEPTPEEPTPAAARDAKGQFAKKPKGNTKSEEESIARATWYRRKAEREAQEATARVEELSRELAKYQAQQVPIEQESARINRLNRDPTAFPTEEQYFAQNPNAAYSSYWDAKLEHRLAQDRQRWQQEQQQQLEQQRLQQSFEQFEQAALKKDPNFRSLYQEALAHGVTFSALVGSVLLHDPDGPDLAVTLLRNPAKVQELNAITHPVLLGKALASLTRDLSAPTAREARVRTSAAPAPIQPVGSGSKTTAPTLSELADSGDDYDSSGYREARAAQRKAVRR